MDPLFLSRKGAWNITISIEPFWAILMGGRGGRQSCLQHTVGVCFVLHLASKIRTLFMRLSFKLFVWCTGCIQQLQSVEFCAQKRKKVWRSIIHIEPEPDSPSENWDMYILDRLKAYLFAKNESCIFETGATINFQRRNYNSTILAPRK